MTDRQYLFELVKGLFLFVYDLLYTVWNSFLNVFGYAMKKREKEEFNSIVYRSRGYGLRRITQWIIIILYFILLTTSFIAMIGDSLTSISGLIQGIAIFLGLLFMYYVSVKSIAKFYKSYNEKMDMYNVLNRFIFNNNLVQQKNDINDQYGTGYRVTSSVRLGYNFSGQYLIIRAYNNGDMYSDRIGNLEHLSAVLDMSISKKDTTINRVDYYFRLHEVERLDMSEILERQDNKIIINDELSWKLNQPNNMAITGISGSGKTYFANAVITQIVQVRTNGQNGQKRQAPDVYFIDPKMADIYMMGRVYENERGYVGRSASKGEDIANILENAYLEMMARYEDMFNNIDNAETVTGKNADIFGYNDVVIIIDEWAAFKSGVEDKKVIKKVDGYLNELILKGRQVNFGVILISQRLDAKLFENSATRESLQIRCLLGTASGESQRMMFTDTEELEQPTQKGQGYIFIEGKTDKPVKFLTPYFSEDYNIIKEFKNSINKA